MRYNADLVLIAHSLSITVDNLDTPALAQIMDIDLSHAASLMSEADERFNKDDHPSLFEVITSGV